MRPRDAGGVGLSQLFSAPSGQQGKRLRQQSCSDLRFRGDRVLQLYMIVEPSSALRICTSLYRIAHPATLGAVHVGIDLARLDLCLSTVCVVDSFWRRSEGKSEALVLVTMVREGGMSVVCQCV